jgi:hypothetical protein
LLFFSLLVAWTALLGLTVAGGNALLGVGTIEGGGGPLEKLDLFSSFLMELFDTVVTFVGSSCLMDFGCCCAVLGWLVGEMDGCKRWSYCQHD